MCILLPLIYLRLKLLDLEANPILFKQVPVTIEYGLAIFDNVVLSHDWSNVSKRLLKTLEFRLSDACVRIIDLRGMPISFSLVFMQQDD